MARKENTIRPTDIQRCNAGGCDRRPWARGFCKCHYDKHLKSINPEYRLRQLENQRRWLARHPGYRIENQRRWLARHPGYRNSDRQKEARRAVRSRYAKKFREDKLALLEAQGGRCALCGVADASVWHWDHDHNTGHMRSVLCTKCNNGLGFFNDDPDRLIAAAGYIKLHRQRVDRETGNLIDDRPPKGAASRLLGYNKTD